jgi:hypothetical protein
MSRMHVIERVKVQRICQQSQVRVKDFEGALKEKERASHYFGLFLF